MANRFPFFGKPIVLASSSPRRRYLLRLVGIKHRVVDPSVAEEIRPDEDPAGHVSRLSRLKAHSVAHTVSDGFVLGADTIVVLDGEILGKPIDENDARSTLRRLCGRWHEVYTGLTLVDAASGKEVQGFEHSHVKIRRLSDGEIDAYIATGEPMDKAGSYGIQGFGAALVEKVNGCYFNVVGLPLVRLLYLLRDLEKICGGS
jgi:septum formation protein